MQGKKLISAVKWHLAHYWEIRKAVHEEKLERKRRKGENVGGVQTNRQSDPTALEAIKDLSPIKYVRVPGFGLVKRPEDWITAIEAGLDACSDDTKIVVKESFWAQRSWKYITMAHGMDKKTFYKKRDSAVYLVAIAAAERGLINISGDDKKYSAREE